MKKLTLKDIAKLVGVAPSTVSLVLNGKARQMRISEVLADKIMKVAADAAYQPNQLAVSLRTGKSKILGLIVESISGNFFGSLAKIIEDEAEKFDYRVVYCSTENNARKGQELTRMLSQRHVDGYLITPTMGMEDVILELLAQKRPLVLIDSYFPEIEVPHVLVDNYAGVKEGMERLTSKGYERIGYVSVDLPLVQIKLRHLAYTQTMQACSIPEACCHVLKIAYKQQREVAIGQISSFIKKSGLQAVFFATNYLGILGLESIQQLRLSIPDDIAMMCFDDHDVFRLYPPGISVMRQPVEEIAITAVQLLMDQLGKTTKSNDNTRVLLPAKFIERGSILPNVKGS